MRNKLISLALATLLAFTVAACGGDSDEAKSSDGDTRTAAGTPAGVTLSGKVTDKGTVTASADEIEIDVYDDYFGPTFVKVQPSKKYVVKLHNEGQHFHTFTVPSLNVDVSLQPGEKKDVDLTTPASGFAEYFCKPHAAIGMRGALFVG